MTRSQIGRRRWERRWDRLAPEDFPWHASAPPPQLVELLADGRRRSGAALDLGCGAGIASIFLARTFRPAVGIDIAEPALAHARRAAPASGAATPAYAVADAASLPFRRDRFAFVFDRGCLQSMERETWPRYFGEVERILRPGGEFQLFVSKTGPIDGWVRGRLRAMRRRLARAPQPSFVDDDDLLSFVPASLEQVRFEHFPFVTATGQRRDFTHALFRKAG